VFKSGYLLEPEKQQLVAFYILWRILGDLERKVKRGSFAAAPLLIDPLGKAVPLAQ
jgi:hypothetical protein